ncbi:MAG: dihydrofolate reductase family protein, partial [Candidatus Helarchaeales archaeon]
MSVDGKIASRTGDCEFSDEEDWKRVHELRASVDAIMVGRNTIEKDDSKLTIKQFPDHPISIKKYPSRIVVDSLATIPLTARVFTVQPEKYPTIIAVTSRAPADKILQIEQLGAKVLTCGNGQKVDLVQLMRMLRREGIQT